MAETSTYDYLFKQVFGDGPVNLLPEQDIFQRMFPFSKPDSPGEEFVEAVDLEFEHGFTFGGNDVAPTLRAAISAEGEKAKITPSQIIGRKVVGYRDYFRTDEAGKKAFKAVYQKKVTDLVKATRRNVEISIIHGQSTQGIGVVEELTDATHIKITAATWAPGVWSGSRNMVIDVYQSNGSTLRQGDLVIVSHDPDTRTLEVSGTTTGIAATDIVYRDTANAAGTFKECVGVKKILMNTGTLFNISAATHPLWKANSSDAAGTLSFSKLVRAVAKGVPKGLTGTTTAIIPARAFEEMNIDQAALRQYDGSYNSRKALNGVESLEFQGQTGRIHIVPSIYMMEGEAFILPVDEQAEAADKPVKRIGSTDITFTLPGEDGKIVRQLENTAACEFRNFTDQAPFIVKPGWCTRISGITYPS